MDVKKKKKNGREMNEGDMNHAAEKHFMGPAAQVLWRFLSVSLAAFPPCRTLSQ